MPSDNNVLQQALVEIRPATTRTGPVVLVPYKDRYNYVGFTGLYGLGTEAAARVQESRSTAGLSGLPVFSDTLYVDFDDCPEAAERMIKELEGYQFEVYDSGNRSIHLHISLVPMYGGDVPSAQKVWMEKHYPEADLSIYRTSGMYRLPGTYHSKNRGCKKELISRHEGKPLKIERYSMPIVIPKDCDEDAEEILDRLLSSPTREGERNTKLYKICISLRNSGTGYFEAERLVKLWNKYECSPALTEGEVMKTLHWAYRRSA